MPKNSFKLSFPVGSKLILVSRLSVFESLDAFLPFATPLSIALSSFPFFVLEDTFVLGEELLVRAIISFALAIPSSSIE
ncbi:hypothetical protein D3C86_1610530 [compost metagenome]